MAQPVRGIALHVELEDFNGRTFRWDADASDFKNRPQSLYFRTQRGDGFADAGCSLYRPIDRDYPDLGLLYTMRLISLSGDIVYEGMVIGFPRLADPESQTFQVNAVGWMASAAFRTFRDVYVDRDLTRWGEMSRARKIGNYIAGVVTPNDGTISPDPSTGLPAAFLSIPGNATAIQQVCELVYDGGSGVSLGSIYYDFVRGTNVTASYSSTVATGPTDNSFPTATSNLCASASSTGTLTAASGDRFALVTLSTPAGDGGTDGLTHDVTQRRLAVWGSALNASKRGTAPDDGLYASDVIANIISRFCPKLDGSATIDATSYVIGQLAFHDAITPYAAIQEVNRFHQYELSVWEGRKFYFTQPTAMDDWDWEVRVGDPGVKLSLQGDSIEDSKNGVVVYYTDLVTGDPQILTPETNTTLADTSATNPSNLAGVSNWDDYTIPFPTLSADALQMGVARLAEISRPKSPGTIEVGTQLRDRQGNWQPAYKVRCGERVILSGHPNDAPRRIVDTRWNDTPFQQGLSITVDNTSNRLDALLDRIQSGRAATGTG